MPGERTDDQQLMGARLSIWRLIGTTRLDSRPISAFRIGISLILIKEALLHFPLAELFYSDAGLVPVRALGGQARLPWIDILTAPWVAQVLFAAWGVVALLLLLGSFTRWMTVLNFILITTVSARNPLMLSGADNLLQLLSFWMIFIPLDSDFTWRTVRERWRGKSSRVKIAHSIPALPVWLLQAQVALAYFMAGLFKLLGSPWRDGSAIFQVLQLGALLRPVGYWLAHSLSYPVLQVLTYAVMVIELAFPALVFIPFGQSLLRRLGLSLTLLMHIGIALAMCTTLTDFLLVFSVSYLPFLARPVNRAAKPFVPQKGLALVLALLIIFGLMLWQNADDLRQAGLTLLPPLSEPAQTILAWLGLEQHWQLFAPNPMTQDWSVRAVGAFDDSTHLDLRTGLPPENAIPPMPGGLTEYRWEAFTFSILRDRSDVILDAWSRYECRQFGSRLVTIQLRALSRHWHAPGADLQPLRDDLLWLHQCG